MNKADIVQYWHSVELLQPQKAPRIQKRDHAVAPFVHDLPCSTQAILPWQPDSLASREKLPAKRVWRHTLYAHIYRHQMVADELEARFGSSQGYREPDHSEAALFCLRFDEHGHFQPDSFTLSTEAWFVGCLVTGKDWQSGFADDQQHIRNHALSTLGGSVSAERLVEFTYWVRETLGLDTFFSRQGSSNPFRFVSTPINPRKPERADDPLNSFFLDDLNLVAQQIREGNLSPPLAQFLDRHDPARRIHLDDARHAAWRLDSLLPDNHPPACWPSKNHLGLVNAQQLAVNTILTSIGQTGGILGINGPPGTGKTTLLRDLIAAIVCQRAEVLATFSRASDAFLRMDSSDRQSQAQANDGGANRNVHLLDPALFGFEIIVASSNNGAVENITKELPQSGSIDPSWRPDADHFADIATLVADESAWGLISAALGNQGNRTRFVERYYEGVAPTRKDNDPSTQSVVEHIEGLRAWLAQMVDDNNDRPATMRRAWWQQAVRNWNAARYHEDQFRQRFMQMHTDWKTLQSIELELTEAEDTLQRHTRDIDELTADIARMDSESLQPASIALQKSLDALGHHEQSRPGLLANLLSLWGRARSWRRIHTLLSRQYALDEAAFQRATREIDSQQRLRNSLELEVSGAHRRIQDLSYQRRKLRHSLEEKASSSGAHILLQHLHSNERITTETIELQEAWASEAWRKERAHVFLQALALHRAFLQFEPRRVRRNLEFINSLLTGQTGFKGMSQDAIRSAWATLFMVVPVLSSTFASFDRSFRSMTAGDIGWLLIDEAGQAAPQQAVGALWRSHRAVVVGDPLQLTPIVTVSDAVLEHLRTRHQVAAHWLPNRQSVQTLADEATPWGRMAGPPDQKSWVGLPLVVHRRCDLPMFSIANRIAYDGAMVFGTIAPARDVGTALPTGWIDVQGPSNGNWVPAEGKALEQLLHTLQEDGIADRDIAIITPFKDVERMLHRICRGKNCIHGTIHTMQGKEAAIVILVLGGNGSSDGARNWAVSSPNLLNVAATRARRRLYVIGDRHDWQRRKLFRDVLDLLPEISLPQHAG